jgi:hypothetical protein
MNQPPIGRLVVVGLNSIGQIQWTKKYGNVSCQFLSNVLTTRSTIKHNNSYYYTGCINDSAGKQKGIFLKFNSTGDTAWSRIYAHPTLDIMPQMVTRSVDGGFLISGMFQNWSNGDLPGLLIKTNNSGMLLWQKQLNKVAPNMQNGRAIIQDSATKKIVIVGSQSIGNSSSWVEYDNLLVLDSLGNILSQSNHHTGILSDITATQDNKYIAVGSRVVPIIPGFINKKYSFIYKFDINSPTQPIWKIDNFDKLTYENSFNCVTSLPNGDVLVGGQFDSLLDYTNYENYWTRFTRFRADGTTAFNRYYDYRNTNAANQDNFHKLVSLETVSAGGWIAAIGILNFNYYPLFFVKYDSTGCDSSDCSKPSGIIEKIPLEKNLIYPNPAHTKVNLLNEDGGFEGALIFYSVLGKEILSISRKREDISEIDISVLPSGYYLVEIHKKGEGHYKSALIKY